MEVSFLNVVSTKRSGHHAFIQWLMANGRGRAVHVNNVRVGANIVQAVEHAVEEKATDDGIGEPSSPTRVIINFEGVTTRGVAETIASQRTLSTDITTIIFLRDPLNLVASLIQRKTLPLKDLVMLIRQVLAEKALLGLSQDRMENKTKTQKAPAPFPVDAFVFYNAWLTDPAHRAGLAQACGLQSDTLPGTVTPHGGGSSFDDLEHFGTADTARLLSRWKAHRDTPAYRAMISHPLVAGIFRTALNGTLKDSFGGHMQDDEALAFLQETIFNRRGHRLVDGFLAQLSDRQDLFETIERSTARAKKPLILKASLLGLLGAAKGK